ncbi:MAG: DUF1566 domain-containing protein [Ignavibacteriales bacterium]|nr:MAG: DUF1566 domain-containing protein [Ignavibacteriales bacterium]
MHIIRLFTISFLVAVSNITFFAQSYKIVGTGQTNSYNNSGIISIPAEGQAFYGQNSNYPGNTPSYTDNGDGTITDNVTGLMWEKSIDKNGDGTINYYDKYYYSTVLSGAASCRTGGYTDWRLPTIKELYSLIMYYGAEINPTATSPGTSVLFINTNYFTTGYGDLNATSHGASSDDRIIDAQYATSTLYVTTTMNGTPTMFGVNFVDGRIKGYPSNTQKKYYVLYVRENSDYGINNFRNNGDGTITDVATGLMWMQNDNGTPILWENALSYAENFTYAGYSDWRLPDVKELQSIIDYTRSPSTTNSAAINPVFNCTEITNEAGAKDYPCYIASTTFCSQTPTNGKAACYVAFGRAMGNMNNNWIDVHGAGAQRSDPKTGNPADYPTGFGPQGDAIRIYNYVRKVRNVDTSTDYNESNSAPTDFKLLQNYPNPFNPETVISYKISDYSHVSLKVYDVLGKEVTTLVDEFKPAGSYSSILSSQNVSSGSQGSTLSSGVYFYTLKSEYFFETKKMVLTK